MIVSERQRVAPQNKKKGRSKTGPKTSRTQRAAKQKSTLDDNAKLDIAGVIISALGVVLLVAITSQDTGIATESIAWLFRVIFGLGAFVFPALLIFWGISFFLPNSQISEGRIIAGLSCIFLSAISMISLFMPFEDLFRAQVVVNFGGYVGSGIAWSLIKLTGQTIGLIILIAIMLVGLVITGLSFSALIEKVSEWWAYRNDTKPVRTIRPSKSTGRQTQTIEFGRRRQTPSIEARDGQNPEAPAAPDARTQKIDMPSKKKPIVSKIADDKTIMLAANRVPRQTEGFELPRLELLKKSKSSDADAGKAEQRVARETADTIVDTLNTFNVPSRVVDWIIGPTLTLFKIEIAKNVKLSKVTGLEDNLALALAASTLRILAPIPGESLVGIEVPNALRASVTLGDVLAPAGEGGPLELAIGKDVSGNNIVVNLAKMPHLLIGGTTGSGKSVAINSFIMSILMRATPAEVRFIMIDPKRVEMSLYRDIPHLYVPVVTEASEASAALAWAVTEMERRLKIFSSVKVRDISDYYEYLNSDKATEKDEHLSYLVIVIDELADLMMAAAKEVEASIVRLAQLARAAGIHLIVATQRPEATIVTGLIKSNITHRIAFNVGSGLDSRVILDESGAEKLTGLGDMLYSTPSWPKPKRIQGCFVSGDEIKEVTAVLKQQKDPDYHEEIFETSQANAGGFPSGGAFGDEYLWDAAELVVASGMGSTSAIQRRFAVGYARAGRIMDNLTALGITGPPDGSKPREVFVDLDGLARIRREVLGLDEEINEEDSEFE